MVNTFTTVFSIQRPLNTRNIMQHNHVRIFLFAFNVSLKSKHEYAITMLCYRRKYVINNNKLSTFLFHLLNY